MVKTTTTFSSLPGKAPPSTIPLIKGVLILLCSVPMFAWSSQVARPIFQCTQTNGQLLFTDSGCAGQQRYVPPKEAVTRFPPLTAAELRHLKDLSDRTMKASKQRRVNLQHRQQVLAKQAAVAEKACNHAKAELAKIAAQRRKGYSIKQSEQLSAAQRKHQTTKRKYC
ncbi:MAG: hypothetical protein V2I41_06700 [Pseudomonadales bacterium]|jgi:hypothetical protein|nr:hypothetical protein [Pseudomonadales bacterium]